jgi:phospholipid/cholesterol/gamma-HCH transport system permease protein
VEAQDEEERAAGLLERLGDFGLRTVDDAVQQSLLHLSALQHTFIGPFVGKGPRARHFLHQLAGIGSGSVGIVFLISFMLGLIMALQAVYVLRQFGANIFVADLVGVAMTRELGPLMTAIIVAARCGSSIAAELGTMVVTEEVDALRVMAVDERRYLVAPRFAALALALPGLTIIADVAGIAGGFLIGVLGLEIGFSHYLSETVQSLHMSDILSGIFKSFIFANVIAVVSCHRGLSIRGGPEAVGRATPRAVVTSIIMIIVADVVFTMFFYLVD